jgi:hypothetical protein
VGYWPLAFWLLAMHTKWLISFARKGWVPADHADGADKNSGNYLRNLREIFAAKKQLS